MIWGSHTIKVLCSYGIGTGVPSAGMIAFGSGVIAMLLATKFGMLAPIVALVLAAVIGFILGYVSNNILNMKIPAMVQALTEMAVVGALTVMGFAAMITGGFTFTGLTTSTVSFLGLPITTTQTHSLVADLSPSHSCLAQLQSSTRSTRAWDPAGNRTGCSCSPQSADF